MKLPLRDERGGGRKEKQHVHHLFDQRLYSTIHSYLATLANYNSFICAHAPEVPYSFHTFAWAPGLFFLRTLWTLPGHVLQLAYLFRMFWTFSI